MSAAHAGGAEEAHARFRAVFEHAPIGMALVSLEAEAHGRPVLVNPCLCQILGYSEEQLLSIELSQLRGSDDGEEAKEQARRLVAREIDDFTAHDRLVRADGTTIWCQIRVSHVDGPPVRYLMLQVEDIGERRDLQRRLQRFASIVHGSPNAILSVDRHGRVTSWNPAAERIYGYGAEEMLGESIDRLAAADHPQRSAFGQILRALQPDEDVQHFEMRNVRRDGTAIDVSLSAAAEHDPDGRIAGATVIARDVSDRKRLEAQLRQAQKLEAVGLLAGGVAHDFNNLLTVIGGYTALARQHDGSGAGSEALTEIARACERATELTRQLLAFSRQQVLDATAVDLNAIITALVPMLRRLIGEDIEIVVRAEPHLTSVCADRGQLEQVIVNLAVNARDAMPDGGTLTIRTDTVELDHGNGPRRPFARLTVTDTGRGMDDETAAQVFEPFFTTKPMGHGTGLGLATVHGIVAQSGGTIQLDTQPGRGTSFEIHLPPATTAATPTDDAARSHAETPERLGGTETILLCEDEDGVRILLEHILASNGYTVLAAGLPSVALELAASHPGPIAALLSDVVMPEMAGPELADRLQHLRPGLRTIFASGYTDQTIRERGNLPAGSVFIEKPFQSTSLLRAIRALLDQPEREQPDPTTASPSSP